MIEDVKVNMVSNHIRIRFKSDVDPDVCFLHATVYKLIEENDDEGFYELEIRMKDFNYLENKVFINSCEVVFERFSLDQEKFYDDFYMTESLINASARDFSPDEIYYIVLNYMKIIPDDSPYLGAFITLLSYRILDDVDNRNHLYDFIDQRKKSFDAKIDKSNPHSIRWFISSSATLSMLALVLDRVDDAYNILNNLQNNSHLAEFNALSYWNYCQAMALLGLIYVDKGNKKEAGTIFITTFIFSRNSLVDIYSPRNDWLLGQLSDCTALLEIGKMCLICGSKSFNNKIPAASRVSSFNAKDKVVNLAPIFIRFKGLNLQKSSFFQRLNF